MNINSDKLEVALSFLSFRWRQLLWKGGNKVALNLNEKNVTILQRPHFKNALTWLVFIKLSVGLNNLSVSPRAENEYAAAQVTAGKPSSIAELEKKQNCWRWEIRPDLKAGGDEKSGMEEEGEENQKEEEAKQSSIEDFYNSTEYLQQHKNLEHQGQPDCKWRRGKKRAVGGGSPLTNWILFHFTFKKLFGCIFQVYLRVVAVLGSQGGGQRRGFDSFEQRERRRYFER